MAVSKTKEALPQPYYGPWEQYTPTENSGWSFFPFDVTNWLTSEVHELMNRSDRGMYADILAIQWRDGYLWSNPVDFSKQLKVDARTGRAFLAQWGTKIFTCLTHPGSKELVNLPNTCGITTGWFPDDSGKYTVSKQKRRRKATGYLPDTCGKLVNGKLHFLAINKGKVVIPRDTDRDEELKEERDNTNTAVFFNPTQPHSLTQEGWLVAVSGFSCLGCEELTTECGCWYRCWFCPESFQGKSTIQAHLQTDHRDKLCR